MLSNNRKRQEKKQKSNKKSLLKTIYFLAKRKWAVKYKYEEILNFLSDIGDLQNAPCNATHISTSSAEQFLKVIGDYLNEKLVTDVLAAGEFSVLVDESTDKGDCSQMAIFLLFVNITTNKAQERFGIVKLTKSKKACIINVIESKALDEN